SSGSEVAQAAFRLARATTGKRIILKFEGHYHGWFDNILWSTAPGENAAGPADAPVLVPGSKGQDPIDAAGLDVIGWNSQEAVGREPAKGRGGGGDRGAGQVKGGGDPPRAGLFEGGAGGLPQAGRHLDFGRGDPRLPSGRGGRAGPFGRPPRFFVFPQGR